MAAPIELPMAITGCGLDEAALAEQLGRYRRVGNGASVIRRSPRELVADLASGPDPELLETTIAVERGCCPFFELDYAAAERRLTVSVGDPAHIGDLDAIEAALRGASAAAQEEATEPSRPHTGQDS